MADEDLEVDIDDLTRRMEGAMTNLRTEFASLRTGRASASMIEPVTVDAYGAQTPINQIGTVNVPEPRMVTINVWDKSLVQKVEKAIMESGLGINPQTNGTSGPQPSGRSVETTRDDHRTRAVVDPHRKTCRHRLSRHHPVRTRGYRLGQR